MLDKALPYCSLFMLKHAATQLPKWSLPTGFSYSGYTEGAELDWAAIETSAGEFPTTVEALEHFAKEFSPFARLLPQRMLFIQNNQAERVATITNWWKQSASGRVAALHWVAVKDSYQGLGLGKALVAESLRRLVELEGACEVCLSTQTWSHRAVNIYLRAGFEFMTGGTLNGAENTTRKALQIMTEHGIKLVPALL